MRNRILLLLFLVQLSFFSAQQKTYWLIDSDTQLKKSVVDSLAATKFLDSLVDRGYFFTNLDSVKEEADRILIYYKKGKNYNAAYVDLNPQLSADTRLSSGVLVKNLDSLKQEINKLYSEKGFTFNRVKSKYLGMQGDFPLVELLVEEVEKRLINGFVIKGYEKVPVRFRKNLERTFVGKAYNESRVREIQNSLRNHPFVAEQQPPETLFTRDSTTVYLYLQKKKSNAFDGVIGFGNDKRDKFTLNGTLDVSLRNMFNGFEQIALYWQRNPDSGQTFNLSADVPYVFKSNLGFDGRINIYRQDSLYANVKLQPSFYYNFSLKSKAGIRGNFEISSVLSDFYTAARDFNKLGIGLWYEFNQPSEVELFLQKLRLRVSGDLLKVRYQDGSDSAGQTAFSFVGENNFHLSGRHYLNVKGEAALLHSQGNFLENELLRFGGWDSMRGFNEKSLMANSFAYAGTEYRYLLGQQAFFDAFAQLGTLRNKFLDTEMHLYSFGVGFNYRLPIGVMSFQISSGNIFGQKGSFRDTKVHWGLVSRF